MCIGVALAVPGLWAQQGSGAANRAAPATRAAEIELERDEKATELRPDEPTGIEHVLNVIKQKKVIERITSGVAGFRVHLGGLITGSGFAAGPEYYRRDLLHDQARFRASARGSLRKFYLFDADFNLPTLADDHAFLELYGVHRNYPHIDYYGPGPDSSERGRSGFHLEDTSFEVQPGIKPIPHLRLGGLAEYYLANVSRGEDNRFVSTDRIFTEQTTPGIQFQSYFLAGGGFAQYDWRDNPGGPRRGGNYLGSFTSYSDTRWGRYSFDRVRLEAQQYFSLFNQRRVIALRARIEATDPHSGQAVPFYLQPTLGGSEDLRGFRPFRFYDNNSVLAQAEYRWEVFSGLDMALFADAGRVFHNWRQMNFRDPEIDGGFGFRFNVRNDVFMRIDTGFSREGFQVWLKFNNVF